MSLRRLERSGLPPDRESRATAADIAPVRPVPPRAGRVTQPSELVVTDESAHAAFLAELTRIGWKTDSVWTTGYANYEWNRLRHLLEAHGVSLEGKHVFELGFNMGASSVVLGKLGARVSGVEIDARMPPLARLNIARHGLPEADLRLVAPGADGPFGDGTFDLVICNSVLEYVDAQPLLHLQRELARILRPGGLLLVCGTANGIYPWGTHDEPPLANWVPQALHRLIFGRNVKKGLMPWRVLSGPWSGWRNLDAADGGAAYLRAREAFGVSWSLLMMMRLGSLLLRPLGLSVGLLAPSISIMLRRPDR